jgi:hypothetical protein
MTALLSLCFIELFVFSVFPLIQDVARRSQEKSRKLKAVESGLWELQTNDRRTEEEIRKNICDTLGVKYSKPIGRMFCMF